MTKQALLAVLAVLAMALAAATSASAAEPALSWSTPQTVSADTIVDVDCPTTDLCVAVSAGGEVITSTNPSGPASGWTAADLADASLHAVSCSSPSLCVAVGAAGNLVTATNPTGGAAAWTTTNVGVGGNLRAIDCTIGLCAAVDGDGQIITSTNPTGGSAAWSVADVQGSTSFTLSAIECPSAGLCVGVGSQFRNLGGGFSVKQNVVATATNPTGGVGAWTKTFLSFNSNMSGISCPSTSFCLIVDGWGRAWSSTNPTGGETAWSEQYVDSDENMTDVSCPSDSFCVALDKSGQALTSSNPTGDLVDWGFARIPEGILSLSCPSTTACHAAGLQQVVTGTPPTPEPPAQPPSPSPGHPFHPPAAIALRTPVLVVKDGKANAKLACMGYYICSGRIKVEWVISKGPKGSARRQGFQTIGSTHFSFRGFQDVTIRLNKGPRKLLEEKKQARARVQISGLASFGQTLAAQRWVTLKQRS